MCFFPLCFADPICCPHPPATGVNLEPWPGPHRRTPAPLDCLELFAPPRSVLKTPAPASEFLRPYTRFAPSVWFHHSYPPPSFFPVPAPLMARTLWPLNFRLPRKSLCRVWLPIPVPHPPPPSPLALQHLRHSDPPTPFRHLPSKTRATTICVTCTSPRPH